MGINCGILVSLAKLVGTVLGARVLKKGFAAAVAGVVDDSNGVLTGGTVVTVLAVGIGAKLRIEDNYRVNTNNSHVRKVRTDL